MNTERVKTIIDNRLITLFREGSSISEVVEELKSRSDKFFSILEKDENLNILTAILQPDSVSNSRLRYATYYVIIASKRIEDLQWMLENKNKFPQFDSQKLFKLIQLRDKISNRKISEVVI